VLGLQRVQAREGAAQGQPGRVAGEHADGRGRHQLAGGLGAQAPLAERQHRLVVAAGAVVGGPRAHERLAQQAQLAPRAQQVRGHQRQHVVGQGAEAPAPQQQPPAGAGARGDQLGAEAQLLDQPLAVGRAAGQGVRPRLAQEPVAALAADDAARAIARVQHHHRPPAPLQPVGEREPRDAAAHHDHRSAAARAAARHRVAARAVAHTQPWARAAASARSASASTNAGCVPTVRARAKCLNPRWRARSR
jgi:hypothetical protein